MTEPVATPERLNWLGRRFIIEIGAVAHGGHCVGRHEGRVVFVRHALPGESVTVEVTEDGGGSFCRADAVEIHRPSPHRVEPPCRYAHPGGCGGCDFQHSDLVGQRGLKAAVVREQLQRLAGLDRDVTVEELPGTPDGLGWRRRVRFAVDRDQRLGLRAHRSHAVIGVEACAIGAPGVGDAPELAQRWPGFDEVELGVDDEGSRGTLGLRGERARGNPRRSRQAGRQRATTTVQRISGPAAMTYLAGGRAFRVTAGGFWQTHPAAAEAFTAAVLEGAQLGAGDRVIDLYAGAGLFTAVTATQVGATGRVLGLEGNRAAVDDAAENLADLPWAEIRHQAVTPASVRALSNDGDAADVTVLDPPRTGAGREIMAAVMAGTRRRIIYVACDPAALARDISCAQDAGWELASLRAFDAFPMTHHVECVATLAPR